MVEEKRGRAESNVSDIDLTDLEHCILCFNEIQFYAMGTCDHKNVCHKCSLRIRLVMNDKHCSICKTELDEIVVASKKDLTWDEFERKIRK